MFKQIGGDVEQGRQGGWEEEWTKMKDLLTAYGNLLLCKLGVFKVEK